ncbi:MAG: hypothetical protein WC415_04630 [Patescibacteria group bacterium]|jgi:phenylacetate-CoA ligase
MFNWRKPIIYLLLHISGSKIPQNLSLIKKLDKLSLEEKKKYQDEKLKALLFHTYKNVPYYTKVLKEAEVIKDNVVVLDNFKNIPLLTKEIIRREGENLYSKDYKSRKFYENTSGGSTGEPVRFIQDKSYEDWNNATKIYYKLTAGQNIGDRELRFWGSERDLLEGKEKLSIRLRNWLYNRREFNTFKMSEKEMLFYVEKWNKYNPKWIEAYVQSIYEFAKFIEKNNLKIKSPKNGILTSAGTLFPEMKQTVEKVFKCKVYNRYGSREVGGAAFGNKELNISYWNQKIELVNPINNIGKILITNLKNYSMPLIRYEIGDIGVDSITWGNIKSISGREMSIFKTKDGKIIPAEFFIHFIGVVYNNNAISKFQVIQKEYDKILIKTVINNINNFNSNKGKIENAIRKEMGNDCKINWEFVNDIEPLKNGKYLYTICEIK